MTRTKMYSRRWRDIPLDGKMRVPPNITEILFGELELFYKMAMRAGLTCNAQHPIDLRSSKLTKTTNDIQWISESPRNAT